FRRGAASMLRRRDDLVSDALQRLDVPNGDLGHGLASHDDSFGQDLRRLAAEHFDEHARGEVRARQTRMAAVGIKNPIFGHSATARSNAGPTGASVAPSSFAIVAYASVRSACVFGAFCRAHVT